MSRVNQADSHLLSKDDKIWTIIQQKRFVNIRESAFRIRSIEHWLDLAATRQEL